MIEICYIAKLFQAEQIYNTCINFIRNNIDSSFSIPQGLFEDKKYFDVKFEDSPQCIEAHHIDFNDLDFEDDSQTMAIHTEVFKHMPRTACYAILIQNHKKKNRQYFLMSNDKILYGAKLNVNEIYIENNQTSLNVAVITRNHEGYNIIKTTNQEFKIKYAKFGDRYSLNVSFNHEGRMLDWKPKHSKSLKSFQGGYRHVPIQSKKNMILQNYDNRPTFIVRKISKETFEAECNKAVDPLVVFSIALSEIIGPLSRRIFG